MTLTQITEKGIKDGEIKNVDINTSAAIAGSKIDPSFTSNITITNTSPIINLTDSDNNSDFRIVVNGGEFFIQDTTNSNATRLRINSSGTVVAAGNLDVGAGIDITGAITGTGDLTIDTNTLHVDSSNNRVGIGTTSPSAALHIEAGGNNLRLSRSSFDDFQLGIGTVGGINGLFISNQTDNFAAVSISEGCGADALVLASGGNVGIGTTSPDEKLHISGNSSGAISAKIENTYSSDATRFAILELKSGVGSIRFHDQGDTIEGEIKYDSTNNFMLFATNGNQERARIDSSGNLSITDGDLVIGTAGHGIDFSNAADQATGETATESVLNDYEAGSFEPSLQGSSGSGMSWAGDNTYNGGYYVRIGRIVYISMNIRGTFTLGSGGGVVLISGLPYVSGNTEELTGIGNANYSVMNSTYYSGIVPDTGKVIAGGMVVPNSQIIYFYQLTPGSAVNPTLSISNVSTATDGINIHMSGAYLVT